FIQVRLIKQRKYFPSFYEEVTSGILFTNLKE
ncbi:unnamed protein product, partial [Rotaria socialis]